MIDHDYTRDLSEAYVKYADDAEMKAIAEEACRRHMLNHEWNMHARNNVRSHRKARREASAIVILLSLMAATLIGMWWGAGR